MTDHDAQKRLDALCELMEQGMYERRALAILVTEMLANTTVTSEAVRARARREARTLQKTGKPEQLLEHVDRLLRLARPEDEPAPRPPEGRL